MARKKSNAIDRSRQALTKLIRDASKDRKRAASKKRQLAKRNQEKDSVAKWRALKKLGLINTKNPPSAKRLNSRLKKKIDKAFFDFQREGRYTKGKTIRPLTKIIKKTKRGESVSYQLDDYFKLIRTKNKTQENSNLIKTSKGYIVKRRNKNSKVRITKKGDVLETINGERYRRRSYSGSKILDLYAQIKSGDFKMPRGERMVLAKFGSFHAQEMYESDSLDQFIKTIDAYAHEMTHGVFEDFLDRSEVMFISGDNDGEE